MKTTLTTGAVQNHFEARVNIPRNLISTRSNIAALVLTTRRALGLLAVLTLCAPGCMAQGSYSYSYGDSRVINSNQGGLVRPSGSYIGPGTMSQSAKGVYGQGAQTNPGLPRVNMGANVATPGDNMYGGNPTRVNSGNAMNGGGSNPGLPGVRLGANVGTAGDSMRSDLNGPTQVRREVFRPRYIQLQNNAQNVQQQSQQMSPTIMAPGGVATYDDAPIKQRINY